MQNNLKKNRVFFDFIEAVVCWFLGVIDELLPGAGSKLRKSKRKK